MFGDSLGVPAVWVLVSIIVFGRIFGILGVVVSIPLAAILTYMYQSWIVIKLEKRRESNELQRSINQAKSTAKNTGQKS
jgi:predicted PurR-regulated permease PerM